MTTEADIRLEQIINELHAFILHYNLEAEQVVSIIKREVSPE